MSKARLDNATDKPQMDHSAIRSADEIERELSSLARHISAKQKSEVLSHKIAYGELSFEIKPDNVFDFCKFLRNDSHCEFSMLIDLCAVDYPERAKRFEIVYHLLSMTKNLRLRVKTQIAEDEPIASLVSVYPAANWFEREAFDLFGILFSSHPDLRRLLTDYGFEGHPLRKDFPLTGFVETRYDHQRKQVVYEAVDLQQEYRRFDFESPWEGVGEPDLFTEIADGQSQKAKSKDNTQNGEDDGEPMIADPDRHYDTKISE